MLGLAIALFTGASIGSLTAYLNSPRTAQPVEPQVLPPLPLPVDPSPLPEPTPEVEPEVAPTAEPNPEPAPEPESVEPTPSTPTTGEVRNPRGAPVRLMGPNGPVPVGPKVPVGTYEILLSGRKGAGTVTVRPGSTQSLFCDERAGRCRAR